MEMITLAEFFKVIALATFFAYAYRRFKTSKRAYQIENVLGLKIK
jgi:hypothetical protein